MGQRHLILGALLRAQLEIVTVERLHDVPVGRFGALYEIRRGHRELRALALRRDLRAQHVDPRDHEIRRESSQQRLGDRQRQHRAIVERLDRGARRRARATVREIERQQRAGLEPIGERRAPIIGDVRDVFAGDALLHGDRRRVRAVVISRRREHGLERARRDGDPELRDLDLFALDDDVEILMQRDLQRFAEREPPHPARLDAGRQRWQRGHEIRRSVRRIFIRVRGTYERTQREDRDTELTNHHEARAY